jgi:hypothetical protein
MKEPPEELLELYKDVVAAMRNGDIEAAADAVLQASAYQGMVNGNMRALELYLIGSGVIEGIQDRKKMASRIASSTVKLVLAGKDEGPEVDYAARLADAGSE